MSFRPIKGEAVTRLEDIRLPTFVSTKLDGVRGNWHGLEMLSSRMKTLPNRNLQKRMRKIELPTGWDGELVVGEPNAPDVGRRTSSVIRSFNGDISELRFFVFDNFAASGEFSERYEQLHDLPPDVIRLDHVIVDHHDDLWQTYERVLSDGYEGLVCRSPSGRYKHGRGTLREQYMLKLKPLEDAEARVIGFEELEHNYNEASINEMGLTKRSSHQENKVKGNTLGALIVDWHGQPLRIGIFKGFTKAELKRIWDHREEYLGKWAKFSYFPIGQKDLPRHCRLLDFRDEFDT